MTTQDELDENVQQCRHLLSLAETAHKMTTESLLFYQDNLTEAIKAADEAKYAHFPLPGKLTNDEVAFIIKPHTSHPMHEAQHRIRTAKLPQNLLVTHECIDISFAEDDTVDTMTDVLSLILRHYCVNHALKWTFGFSYRKVNTRWLPYKMQTHYGELHYYHDGSFLATEEDRGRKLPSMEFDSLHAALTYIKDRPKHDGW